MTDLIICPQCSGTGSIAPPATLGQRLKHLRLQRKLLPNDVEIQAGVLHSTLWRLENESTVNPRVSQLTKLADFYGVTIDYLLRGDA